MSMTFNCDNSRALFSPAFDGRLEADEKSAFDAHVTACGACEAEYRRYERLFSTLRGLPGFECQRPAPFPSGAASFGARRAELIPSRPRPARIAAAAALLVAVGVGAYAVGLGMRPGRETSLPADVGVVAEAAVDPVQLPEPESGARLHRLVRGTRNLGLVVESVADLPEERLEPALRAVSGMVENSPLEADARHLRNADSSRLRGYTAAIHDLALEVESLAEKTRDLAARRSDTAAARLARLQAQMRSERLRERVRSLERLAELYELPPAPFDGARPAAPEAHAPDLLGGFNSLVCGEPEQARILLRRAVRVNDEALRRMGFALAIGRGIDLGLKEGQALAPGASPLDIDGILSRESGFWVDSTLRIVERADGTLSIMVLRSSSQQPPPPPIRFEWSKP